MEAIGNQHSNLRSPDENTRYGRDSIILFDLPRELRDIIYCEIFENIVAPVKHPYDPLPPTSRFQAHNSLLRTCRQMCEEAQDLFSKLYAHRVVIYCDRLKTTAASQSSHELSSVYVLMVIRTISLKCSVRKALSRGTRVFSFILERSRAETNVAEAKTMARS